MGTDRPIFEESEVTPEMIDAASSVLERHYFGGGIYDVSNDVIAEVARAILCEYEKRSR